MASYIDDNLIQGERVLHRGRISLWSLSLPIFIGLLLLPLFGAGLLVWLWVYIRYRSTELAVTNKRVVAKFGFISRQTMEMNINKVESMQVNQSMLGRVFNFGSLVISGTGTSQEPIPGISKPLEFRRAFMEAQDEASRSGR